MELLDEHIPIHLPMLFVVGLVSTRSRQLIPVGYKNRHLPIYIYIYIYTIFVKAEPATCFGPHLS